MNLQQPVETDILIRLTESGFVETTRCFGLPERILFYETVRMESLRDDLSDERLVYVRPRQAVLRNERSL